MRATGYPRKAMLSSMLTVGCNIILAPVFIFWLGWGIRGAATATILSQFAGMIWVLSHFMQEKSYIRFKKGIFKLRKRIVREYLSIGMVAFLMNVCASAIVIIFNKSLLLLRGAILGYRRIRHIKPSADAVCNGYHGADYGNATDCGL